MKATLKTLLNYCKDEPIRAEARLFILCILCDIAMIILYFAPHNPVWIKFLYIGSIIFNTRAAFKSLDRAYIAAIKLHFYDVPAPCDHGTKMPEIIYNLRHLPYECLAIFDENGSKVTEFTCHCPIHVMLPDQNSALGALVYKLTQLDEHFTHIHNHSYSNSAFSDTDFALAIKAQLAKSIVVTPKMVYTIELTPECWKLDHKEISAEYNRLWQIPISNGLFRHNETTKAVARTVTICQYLAKKYGFTFTAESYKKSTYYQLYKEQKKSDT